MIIGTGVDLCDIRRLEAVLARHGDRFLARVFTETERARAARLPHKSAVGTLAKRFAAKEAMAKALGTGFARGVYLSTIGVVNHLGGRPALVLTDGAAARLSAITPAGHTAHVHLTLTDEYPTAQAQVLIEALQFP